MQRRDFLARSGLIVGAAAMARAGLAEAAPPASPAHSGNRNHDAPLDDWQAVRDQFTLAPNLIHMSGFYLASHPTPVREAIERHRRGLDDNPLDYHHEHAGDCEHAVREAAGDYLGATADDIMLTDSTTMGLGLLYGNLTLREGQEILTTEHDHYSTHRSLELRAERTGAKIRDVRLYKRSGTANVDEIVSAIRGRLTPKTRVVAVTWVHSSTGVKLPIRAIADVIAEANRGRDADDRAVLCVDGVHGLGIEDVTMAQLGCDFFIAGTHKWMFGPRGTGLMWGRKEARGIANAVIPSFSFGGRSRGRGNDSEPAWGSHMTPGGFHSFEHRWALVEAFRFHQRIGKKRVADRIHGLNTQLKEGLAAMKHVTLHTPMSADLSAGIVCFEVEDMSPGQVVERLAAKRIVASESPYDVSYARLAPSLLNSPEQVDTCLSEVRALA